MSAKILSIEAAKQANISLPEEGKGQQALYQTLVAYRAARRLGTACTKSRDQVAGSGKKLWKQKGTGNARMGSRRSPIWRGGGVVWGPKPRDYSKKVNAKVKQLALRAALAARIHDGDVIVTDQVQVADGKTKSFIKLLKGVTDAQKVAVVGQFDQVTLRAARNLGKIYMVRSEDVNAEHLLNCQKVIITHHALEILARRTASE